MTGRYTKRHNINTAQYAPTPVRAPTAQDKQNEDGADFWRFVSDVAPAAGTAIGGIGGALIGGLPTGGIGAAPGAALGATLGGSAGALVGGLAKGGAKAMTAERADYEKLAEAEEIDKADRKSALLGALLAMRR